MRSITGHNAERRGDKWISKSPDMNVEIEPNDGRQGTFNRLRYLQKEREGSYEGWLILTGRIKNAWEREKPAPIRGARVSRSGDLDALIEADADRRPKFYVIDGAVKPIEAAPREPLALQIVYRDNNLLFDDLPVQVTPERSRTPPTKRPRLTPPSPPLPALALGPNVVDMLAELRRRG